MSNENIITLENLRMKYGSHEVLKGVNLEIKRGQIIGYIGANGAGKSTTVKILLGMVNGYTGSVKIFGRDISDGNVEYKRRIGYIPEIADLYDNLTAREYLTFLGEIYDMDYDSADKKCEKLMSLFNMEDSYNSRICSYSKGMKQKLMIVASIFHNPDILFLDEPLAGLDANSVMVFKELLSQMALEGKTIFYSSHIMDVVEKISTRIILLNNGTVLADGSFNELKSKSKEGSLEEIFNDLTHFDNHNSIAAEFLATIKGV
ncbi:ABC transporter ATP-binding protein [Clostridium grantii]|uniref:ABC-2 type transport system ATP-binding protein n=1 Tax=Clostridium grantii DSM 8605 TaxID=1121316 RepID=A0A1M5WRE2_9CLOT|nr:ABC transporter ATP-binding protein [Clostridium grantii]SHH90079.1 ABC-2 type transport system ATP-binding protein [Clostridium grantii DSM 8605]